MLKRRALHLVNAMLKPLGARLALTRLPDVDDDTLSIIERVSPFTMTSPERLLGVIAAADYVAKNGIEGDFVECGVWRGGSSMAAALTFLRNGRSDIGLHLFDTYTGMTEPTEADKLAVLSGAAAADLLSRANKTDAIWCNAQLED